MFSSKVKNLSPEAVLSDLLSKVWFFTFSKQHHFSRPVNKPKPASVNLNISKLIRAYCNSSLQFHSSSALLSTMCFKFTFLCCLFRTWDSSEKIAFAFQSQPKWAHRVTWFLRMPRRQHPVPSRFHFTEMRLNTVGLMLSVLTFISDSLQ